MGYYDDINNDEFKSLPVNEQLSKHIEAFESIVAPNIQEDENRQELLSEFISKSFEATKGVDYIDYMKSKDFLSIPESDRKKYVDSVYDFILKDKYESKDSYYQTLEKHGFYSLNSQSDINDAEYEKRKEASDVFIRRFDSSNKEHAKLKYDNGFSFFPKKIDESFKNKYGVKPHQFIGAVGVNIAQAAKSRFIGSVEAQKQNEISDASDIINEVGGDADSIPSASLPQASPYSDLVPKSIRKFIDGIVNPVVLSEEQELDMIKSIASKKELDGNDLSFLVTGNKVDKYIETISDSQSSELKSKIEKAYEKYGDPTGFFSQFKRAANSGTDYEVSGLGKIGSIAGNIAPPLVAGGIGMKAAGPIGGLAGVFSQSSLRDLAGRKERGELPSDLADKSIFEIAEILKESNKKALVDTAITGVSAATGGVVAAGIRGSVLKKALAGEIAATGAGTVSEYGLTGDVSPEGLLLSSIPAAGIIAKGGVGRIAAKAKDRSVATQVTNYIRRIGELDANASTSETSIKINENAAKVLKAATPEEKSALSNAIINDHIIQTSGFQYKAGTLKEILDVAQKNKDGADAVVANISSRVGLSPVEIMDIQNRIIPSDIRTAPVSQINYTDSVKKAVKVAQKKLDFNDSELVQSVSALSRLKEGIWNSTVDNVAKTGNIGKRMVDLVNKTSMEAEFMFGQNNELYWNARRELRKTVGFMKEKDALLIGERILAGKKGKKIFDGISVDKNSLEAAKKYAATIRGIADDLHVLQSSVGVRQLMNDVKHHKIVKQDDGTYVIHDREGVVTDQKFEYAESYSTRSSAERARAKNKTGVIQYVKDYRPQSIDWKNIHKASAKDLRYTLEVLDTISEAQLSPEIKTAVSEGGKWDSMDVKEKIRMARKLNDSYDHTFANSPIKRHQIQRAEKKLPSSVLRWDSDIWEQYFRDASEVYANAKNYGVNNEFIYGMAIDVAKEAAQKYSPTLSGEADLGMMSHGSGVESKFKGSEAMVHGLRAKMLADMATGNYQRITPNRFGSSLLAFEMIAKIAFGGQIANIGQIFAPLMYKNGSLAAWTKGVGSLIADIFHKDGPESARSFVAKHGLSMSMSREELVRSMAQPGITGKLRNTADTFLYLTGFNKLDFISRSVAVVTGKFFSMDVIDKYASAMNSGNQKKAARFRDQIAGLGKNADDLVVNDGGSYKPNYSSYDIMQMSKQFEIDTNYRNHVYSLPEWRYGTFATVTTQFKTFMYHTTKAMDKWLHGTFNKNSDPAQIAADLSRFIVASQIGGSLVNFARDLLPNAILEDDTDVVKLMKGNLGISNFILGNISTIGAMGILEVPLAVFKYQDIGLGPGVSDIASTAKFASRIVTADDKIATVHKYMADLSPVMFKGIFNKTAQDREDMIREIVRSQSGRERTTQFNQSLNRAKRTLKNRDRGSMSFVTIPEGSIADLIGVTSQKERLYNDTHDYDQINRKRLRKEKEKRVRNYVDFNK